MSPAKTLPVSGVRLHWAGSLDRNLERAGSSIRAAAGEGSRVGRPPFLRSRWERMIEDVQSRARIKPG